MSRLEELEIENKKLRECVEFYANTTNWRKQSHTSNIICNKIDVHGTAIAKFGGWIATKCLVEVDGE